jgi:hypothetical protein
MAAKLVFFRLELTGTGKSAEIFRIWSAVEAHAISASAHFCRFSAKNQVKPSYVGVEFDL